MYGLFWKYSFYLWKILICFSMDKTAYPVNVMDISKVLGEWYEWWYPCIEDTCMHNLDAGRACLQIF